MASERELRRRAYLDKGAAEVDALVARGVVIGGNAFSSVLLVKGAPDAADLGEAGPLSGADGTALRASLAALGYEPQDWAALLAVDAAGAPLDPLLLREAVACLDPATLVCCDEEAVACVRDAFADELADIEQLEVAMLEPGLLAHVNGMRVLNLGGFAAALSDPKAKQLMWARLKQIPPLAEPY